VPYRPLEEISNAMEGVCSHLIACVEDGLGNGKHVVEVREDGRHLRSGEESFLLQRRKEFLACTSGHTHIDASI
jgi:hypothetical protein